MGLQDTIGPLGPNTKGADFNFYEEVTVSAVADFPEEPQVFMKFRGNRRMLFVCTSGSVEYSFNGNTLHGVTDSATASNQLNFGPRMQDKIWFRGTGTVQVHAWQTNF